MVGPSISQEGSNESPEQRTKEIFTKMDLNKDGVLSKEEFIKGCMADEFLRNMLTAEAGC